MAQEFFRSTTDLNGHIVDAGELIHQLQMDAFTELGHIEASYNELQLQLQQKDGQYPEFSVNAHGWESNAILSRQDDGVTVLIEETLNPAVNCKGDFRGATQVRLVDRTIRMTQQEGILTTRVYEVLHLSTGETHRAAYYCNSDELQLLQNSHGDALIEERVEQIGIISDIVQGFRPMEMLPSSPKPQS